MLFGFVSVRVMTVVCGGLNISMISLLKLKNGLGYKLCFPCCIRFGSKVDII